MPLVGEGGPALTFRSEEGGSSFGASSIDGDFMPREPISVFAVVLEKRLLNVLSLTELFLDGELERGLSRGGLVGLSRPAAVWDMPGNRILPALAPASASSS